MTTATIEKRGPGIWPFAITGALIAISWAALSVLVDPSGGPEPNGDLDRTIEMVSYHAGYSLASAVLGAVVTWAVLYAFFFRNSVSISKSIATLLVMIVLAFLAAAPLRLLAVGNYNQERRVAAAEWQRETNERVDALRETLNSQSQSIAADIGPLNASELDIPDRLQRIQRAIELERQYGADLEAEIQAARGRLAQLDLTDEQRQRLSDDFEQAFVGPATHQAQVELRMMEKSEEIALFLQSTSGQWEPEGALFMFYSQQTLQRFNDLQGELTVLMNEVRAAEPSAATPAGSAPPPPQ
jgi:hypothetical protein